MRTIEFMSLSFFHIILMHRVLYRLLILSDWYHTDGRSLAAGLAQRNFRWMGDPQSILHNGKGNYSCAGVCSNNKGPSLLQYKCTPQTIAQALEQILVETGKTYLLRVISVTTLSFLDFAIEGHNMTIVEADGKWWCWVMIHFCVAFSTLAFLFLLVTD